jgi:hypothetical protein
MCDGKCRVAGQSAPRPDRRPGREGPDLVTVGLIIVGLLVTFGLLTIALLVTYALVSAGRLSKAGSGAATRDGTRRPERPESTE